MISLRKVLLALIFLKALPVWAQVDTVSNLPDAAKVYGLSKFWSEAKYNFVYFDKTKINWDSAYQAYLPKVLATKNTWDYYNTLKEFCALLQDGHTNVNEPGALYKTSRYRYIYIENFDQKLYITNIPVQFKDKVPLGSQVIRVNGLPITEYLRKEIMPYISASTEHQLWNDAARSLFYATDTAKTWNLELKTPQGKTITHQADFHTYRANWVKPLPKYKRFDFKIIDNIGFVQINTFGDTAIISDFKTILPQLYVCQGVILDIRKNGGGDSGIGAEILQYFTNESKLIGSTWRTKEHLAAFKAWGNHFIGSKNNKIAVDSLSDFEQKAVLVAQNNYWFKGDTMTFPNQRAARKINTPLIVLISNQTASAAEDFLIMLSSIKGRATTIGQKSFGSTGQPLSFDLPGGGSARICAKRDTYPNGKDFVGVGIKPDIEIRKNIADVIKSYDTELQFALKEIKKQHRQMLR